MTANIKQSVVPRQRAAHSASWNVRAIPTGAGLVSVRRGRRQSSWQQFSLQRGSVTASTTSMVVGVGTLALLAVLGFVYLQQVLQTASQGADIHALEVQISSLKQEQRQLELHGAQLRSLQTVEERVQKLNLTSADQVAYLSPTSGRVAAAAQR